MSEPIPVVIYWFDVERSLLEFIDTKAYIINFIANQLQDQDDKNFIVQIAHYIRDKYQYPLTEKNEPATSHEWRYYEQETTCPFRKMLNKIMEKLEYEWNRPTKYLFIWKWDYVWQDALMTFRTKYGICIDTAILCTSLLRVRKSVKAYCEAGYVTLPDDPNRYGHAWTSIPDLDILIETTIHDPSKENIVSYKKATTEGINGIKYTPIDRWNEEEYHSLGSWIQVGGFLLAPKSFKKGDVVLWRKKELLKQLEIWRLW